MDKENMDPRLLMVDGCDRGHAVAKPRAPLTDVTSRFHVGGDDFARRPAAGLVERGLGSGKWDIVREPAAAALRPSAGLVAARMMR
jgi:hypothetical protein